MFFGNRYTQKNKQLMLVALGGKGMNTQVNTQKEEKVIVLDLQTGDFSAHTTLDGIFEFCLDDLLTHSWSDDLEMLKSEYSNPSVEQKKELIEQYEYQLLKPTPQLVEDWEAYHRRSFFNEDEKLYN